MTPRRKATLLWGAIGALSFLVAAQGYVLLVARLPVGTLGLLGLAVVVGGVTTVATGVLQRRLAQKEQR
ncbi:MAG: hypothetical protein J07HB67_02050 [halophilic archaeon J07HB67]|nr:MAG: hypothetical protein J07HB67_02050 [halophilic archaeon J07HB67]